MVYFEANGYVCKLYDMYETNLFNLGKLHHKNKYAIHAYTHGPVTGSGPSVKSLKYYVTLLLVELRVLPPSLPYSANVNLTAAYIEV